MMDLDARILAEHLATQLSQEMLARIQGEALIHQLQGQVASLTQELAEARGETKGGGECPGA